MIGIRSSNGRIRIDRIERQQRDFENRMEVERQQAEYERMRERGERENLEHRLHNRFCE